MKSEQKIVIELTLEEAKELYCDIDAEKGGVLGEINSELHSFIYESE